MRSKTIAFHQIRKMLHNNTNHPIDAVITWVDGNDPVLAQKRNQYIAGNREMENHPGALSTRFISNNEIKFCILSIFKFAPFIRNVFIVTDGQQPNIFDEVKKHFPNRIDCIKIVDHTEIFKGYEQYLPTFNSTSIESMLWRIDELSQNFVYFNDDVILLREIKPERWVRNNKPVMQGKWKFLPLKKLFSQKLKRLFNRGLLRRMNYFPKLSFYIRQWKAANLLGYRYRYFFHCHTPHVLNKTSLELFYNKNLRLLENNIKYRFRDEKQFISISLANHIEITNGNTQAEGLNYGYIHPFYSSRQIARKIEQCKNDPKIKSVCIQSLESLTTVDQQKIVNWLESLLEN